MHSAREKIVVLAMSQGGCVGRDQIAASGANRALLSRMIHSGVLERFEGTYRLRNYSPTVDGCLWAAVVRTNGVLSHRSAARCLGAGVRAPHVEVSVDGGRRPRASSQVVMHRSQRLGPAHVTVTDRGLPLTNAPRTLVDLAVPTVGLSDEQLVDCIDAWITCGQASIRWLSWFLDTQALHLPGRRRALALLTVVAGAPVDSSAERALARLLTAAGLGGFVTQFPIEVGGRVVAHADFAWPALRVALELDSYRFHSAPGVFAADRRRGNEIELAGWILLRTTPRDLRQSPEGVVTTVHRALER